ncbi:hypothetical protein V1605_26250 (plasmid) [Enterobacter soli]|uniref:hypothetical protein n=1 Tax=Enterobacter soli TaxID=885040 RepID=UPI003753EF12
MRAADTVLRGVAWRGVAWRGVAWRGVVTGSETRTANSLKTPESRSWPPSAPGQQRRPVVEPHSARQLLRTSQSPPNPFGFRASLGSDG